ncbi:MAG: AMP-dependent synthetase [Bacteroidetes bacterium]|nr:AMP-dependent synthetase [Bacteroidota bacterium]
MSENLTLPNLVKNAVEKYADSNALCFVNEEPINYKEFGDQIDALSRMLEKYEIKQGDKVAILSASMPNWGLAYFAIASVGAITIPILPDFHADEIKNVLSHSEAKMIFVSDALYPKLKDVESELEHIINIEDFSCKKHETTKFELGSKPQHTVNVNEDDLATIIYTSGTTGSSKGVMLSHKNIVTNAIQGSIVQPINNEDRFLSILPLSHTYENTLGLLLPVMNGASVHYLRKPPTPPVLLPALESVKPTVMLTVPLIIEKIYRNKILKTFNSKFITRNLYKVSPIRKKLNGIAGKKLMKTFGGELKFYGIGGAKLDREVEKFLIDAKFPYAIGYGLTETSPLIAGVNPQTIRLQSTGPAAPKVELKINDPDPATGEGEIWAKGPNIMQGYYKDPELTKTVLTDDGWFKTGDLGNFDKDGYLYIKGRLKNMIVGQSGENIYPEEIESVINNFRHVVESVVVQQKGKLVALVHFNREELEEKFKHMKEDVSHKVHDRMEELRNELHDYVNSNVNKFSQVQKVIMHPEPFIKTATMKIKRFLYFKAQ